VGRAARAATTLVTIAAAALVGVGVVFSSGLEALDACDARVRSAPNDPPSYYCYLQAVRAGAPAADAVRRLDAVLAVEPARHRARMILGMIEDNQGNSRAETLLGDAVDGMEAAGDHHGVVYGALALAYRLGKEGRLEESETVVERAARAAETSGDPELQASIWTEQALTAKRRADYDRSLQLYRKAETAVFPDGPAWLKGNVLSGIGWLQWYFGNLRQAMATYRREAEIRQGAGDRFGEAATRNNLAHVALALAERGEFSREACMPLVDEALEVAGAAGAVDTEAHARLLRARLLGGDQAVEECERTIRLAGRIGNAAVRWDAMRILAALKLDLGPEHENEAFALLDAAAEEASQAGMPTQLAYALQQRAALATLARPRDEAIAAWDACIDAVDTIGKLQAEDITRAYALSHWSHPYHRLVDLLLNGIGGSAASDVDLDHAFRTMERRHARSLVEILGNRRARAEAQEFVTLAEVRAALTEGEAMLLWEVLSEREGRSWLVAVTRDAVHVRELPGREDLDDAVTVFGGLLRGEDPLMPRAAADLYAMVVGDVLDELAERLHTVFLIPDGPLHRLPFAALRERDGAEPIGTRMRVDVVPSASLWMRWRAMPAGDGPLAALAMADPEISTAAMAGVLRESGVQETGSRAGALARARDEARAVARAMGGDSRVLVGAEASEHALKTIDPATYRLLHFATHAVVDDARPERSAVLLAAGAGDEDGLLRLGEIAELDLRGHVVILAACRGASGPVVGGEGVLGLARAFLAAGARAVLANRWPFRDDEAAALTQAIAREIARGTSIGDALTAARRARAQSGAPMEAWAGMTLIGDGGVVPVPGGSGSPRAVRLGLALALGAVVGWIVWRATLRRRRNRG